MFGKMIVKPYFQVLLGFYQSIFFYFFFKKGSLGCFSFKQNKKERRKKIQSDESKSSYKCFELNIQKSGSVMAKICSYSATWLDHKKLYSFTIFVC